MAAAAPRFPADGMKFLRALKRNNRREWFQPRKEQYETLVRAPMIAVVAQLASDMRPFAPEVVVDPKRAVFRVYRDTRFSEDKTPYKTHIAASFAWRGLQRGQGAGLYFHVAPSEIWIGGGVYAPDTWQLQALREHVAKNYRRLRSIVESAAFKRMFKALEGQQLQRVPRGFDKDHEAADYLRRRQFLAVRELPGSLAVDATFYSTLLATFRAATPLVRFLNEPLAG
jgi:uncharacterized protein (TIGR02453 family)